MSGDGLLASFDEWMLPAKEFDGLWERYVDIRNFFLFDISSLFYLWIINLFYSLVYETGLKQRLLRYAASALLFTERGVDPCLVSWNR